MAGQSHVTGGATHLPATNPADDCAGESAPVEKNHGLFSPLQTFFHQILKAAAEKGQVPACIFPPHIHDFHLGQTMVPDPAG